MKLIKKGLFGFKSGTVNPNEVVGVGYDFGPFFPGSVINPVKLEEVVVKGNDSKNLQNNLNNPIIQSYLNVGYSNTKTATSDKTNTKWRRDCSGLVCNLFYDLFGINIGGKWLNTIGLVKDPNLSTLFDYNNLASDSNIVKNTKFGDLWILNPQPGLSKNINGNKIKHGTSSHVGMQMGSPINYKGVWFIPMLETTGDGPAKSRFTFNVFDNRANKFTNLELDQLCKKYGMSDIRRYYRNSPTSKNELMMVRRMKR